MPGRPELERTRAAHPSGRAAPAPHLALCEPFILQQPSTAGPNVVQQATNERRPLAVDDARPVDGWAGEEGSHPQGRWTGGAHVCEAA